MKSKQPRKQRFALFNAPLHLKQKKLTAPLSKELRKTKKKRSLRVRRGDEVQVLRGASRKRRGEVQFVDCKRGKIFVKNITKKKTDSSEVMVSLEPSNVMIVKLNEDDKRRF
ncbi:MAG: 50S ribosomal protein L24 [archaeon]